MMNKGERFANQFLTVLWFLGAAVIAVGLFLEHWYSLVVGCACWVSNGLLTIGKAVDDYTESRK